MKEPPLQKLIDSTLRLATKEGVIKEKKKMDILWLIIIILLVAWLFGFAFNVGNLIHLLLIVLIGLLIWKVIKGSK